MKAATNMNGEFFKKLLKLISMLVLMGFCIPSARAGELLYNFDNPGDTTTLAIDSLTADGSNNGNVLYSAWPLVPNSGPGPSGGPFSTTTSDHGPGLRGIITASIINYTNAMTWSAAIKPTAQASSGYTELFWAGWKRGAGETQFYADPSGSLVWYQAGGPGLYTTTATNLFKLNQWQAVGITFDGTVGGGTLDFYVDQVLIQSFTGIGPMVGFGNGGGATTNNCSETVFGLPFNVGGAAGSQYYGLADNIYMADRALSPSEMAIVQIIPEPSMVVLVGLGGLVFLRRNRSRINGEFCRKVLKPMSIFCLMGMLLSSAQATELLYTFDNPGNTTTLAIDSLTDEGSNTGNVLYAAWTLVPASGPGPSGGPFSTTTMQQGPGIMGLITADVINYTNAMTWSAAIKPTAPGSDGYSVLFWAGWRRGTGETEFYVNPNGSLSWYQGGKGTFTTTTTNLFKLGQWQAMGITFDGTVGGGTLDFYVDQQLVQSFTGIGPMIGFGNAGGAVPDPNPHNSETVFGIPFNVGGAGGEQYNGLVDNIYMADRALSPSEMAIVQIIPEPSSVAMMGLGGLLFLRRRQANR